MKTYHYSNLPLIVIIICIKNFSYCLNSVDFYPITENVSFRVKFRIQTFFGFEPQSMSEVYEHYQHNLATASIWETKLDHVGQSQESRKRFIYDPTRRLDIELIGYDEDGPGEVYLEENGSSCSYQLNDTIDKENLQLNTSSINVLSSLDSILFDLNDKSLLDKDDEKFRLNLDMFMLDSCQEKINSKLHYIRGLSKLFHLIECRKKEFLIDLALTGANYTARATKKRVYNSLEFKPKNNKQFINNLKIILTLQDKSNDYNLLEESKELPSQVIPLSLSLNIITIGGKKITFIINLYNFEFINIGEHLSESWSSKSNLLLPAADINLVNILNKIPKVTKLGSENERKNNNNFEEFSFHAFLTGSELSLIYNDPIELVIAYDGKAKLLARQLTTTDRSVLLVGSWKRQTSRMVYDGKSGLKYHIEHSSDVIDDIERLSSNYASGEEEKPASGAGKNYWRSCSTNSLSNQESSQLSDTNINKIGELFDLNNSVFLGMAIVRGIPCYVYEKQLWNLPFWLGFTDYEYVLNLQSESNSKIHLTFYESISDLSSSDYNSETKFIARDKKASKLLRLVISIISTKENKIIMNYNLEIYSFYHSSNLVLNEEKNLFNIGQECIAANSYNNNNQKGSFIKHIDIDMSFESIDKMQNTKFILQLNDDENLRNKLVSNAMVKSFGILEDQLVDLVTSLHTSQDNSKVILDIKVTVFDLPDSIFMVDFICYAKDESKKLFDGLNNNSNNNNWSIGTTRMSLEECKWLTSHTLRVNDEQNHYNSKTESDFRMFMYCPKTKHCILGDSRWTPIVAKENFEIKSILMKGSTIDFDDRCLIYSLKLMRRHFYGTILNKTDGFPMLDWLASNKGLSSMRNQTILIDDSFDNIHMKNSLFKVKNIYRSNENVKLFKPIQGIGYVKLDSKINSLIVDNIAQCSQRCFLEHDCESYSICKLESQIEYDCLMTRVNWTNPIKIRELNKLSARVRGYKKDIKTINNVQLQSDGIKRDVVLKLSPLCSLHAKSHSSVFKLKDSDLIKIPKLEYLIYAIDLNECARFCIDRANIINQIIKHYYKDIKDEKFFQEFDSLKTCTSFEYSEEYHFCTLIAPLNLNRLLSKVELSRDENKTNSQKQHNDLLIDKWLISYNQMKSSKEILMTFSNADIFEVNYEHLFLAYHGERIKNFNNNVHIADQQKDREENNNKMQITYINTSANSCASLCLKWFRCRSFDIFISKEAEHDENLITCYLNAISYLDLKNNSTLTTVFNKQVVKNNDKTDESNEMKANYGGRWLHYEPSDLLFYMMGLMIESELEQKSMQKQSIFISNKRQYSFNLISILNTKADGKQNLTEPSAGSYFLGDDKYNDVNSNDDDHDEHSTLVDWSTATKSHVHGPFYLWFMVLVVFIMLLVVIYYFVTITKRKKSTTTAHLQHQLGYMESTIQTETNT